MLENAKSQSKSIEIIILKSRKENNEIIGKYRLQSSNELEKKEMNGAQQIAN